MKHLKMNEDTTLLVNQTKAFAKCDPCGKFEQLRRNLQAVRPIDHVALQKLERDWNQHVQEQRREREHYYSLVQEATNSPNYSWVFMQDGMDQAKTRMPIRFNQQIHHNIEHAYYLPSHLTGITMAGPLVKAMAFINFPDYSNDAALNVEVLHRALLHSKRLLQDPTLNPRTVNHRTWPRVLNLQADNAGASCKNVLMLSYLAILVHYGHFEQCNMSFMITGT
jgi:hypothetical protein